MRKASVWLGLLLILGPLSSFSHAAAAKTRIDMETIFASRLPVMLQFGKSWCPRCKATKPILDSTAQTFAGRALIVPVDVEANMDLVKSFRIRLIPTQIFLMPDRREFFRHEGVLQERQIAEILTRMGAQRTEVR